MERGSTCRYNYELILMLKSNLYRRSRIMCFAIYPMHIFGVGILPAQKHHHTHTRVYIWGWRWTGYEFKSCLFVPVWFPLIPTVSTARYPTGWGVDYFYVGISYSMWSSSPHERSLQLILLLKQIQIFRGHAGALWLTLAIGYSSKLRPLVRMNTLAPTNESINGRTEWSKT